MDADQTAPDTGLPTFHGDDKAAAHQRAAQLFGRVVWSCPPGGNVSGRPWGYWSEGPDTPAMLSTVLGETLIADYAKSRPEPRTDHSLDRRARAEPVELEEQTGGELEQGGEGAAPPL